MIKKKILKAVDKNLIWVRYVLAIIFFSSLSINIVAQIYPPDVTIFSTTVPALTRPGYLAVITEPTFGTEVVRISDQAVFGQSGVRHDYAKIQPWNSDGTKIRLGNYILNGSTYVKQTQMASSNSDRKWSHTNPNWEFGISGNQFKRYDYSTKVNATLHTFTGYKQISIGLGEGNVSIDDKTIALVANGGITGSIIVYDIANDVIIATKTIASLGFSGGAGIDWVSSSQSGNYIVINGRSSNDNSVKCYDRNLNFVCTLFAMGEHGDLGYDTNGHEVFVSACPFQMARLDNGQVTKLNVSFSNCGHVSCRNIDRPGWAYLEGWNATTGGNIAAIKLDGSGTLEAFAHGRSGYGTTDTYYNQPQAVPNADGTKVMYASDWWLTAEVNSYIVGVPGNGPTSVTKKTPTPVTVDGSLSECGWADASTVTFTNSKSDNIVTARTLWDANFLYMGFEVTDLSIETPDGIDMSEQDAVELYIDAGNEKSLTLDANDYQYTINALDAIAYNHAASATMIEHKVMASPSGYTVEIAIPWSQINTTPVSGKVLGVLFCNDDRDNHLSTTFDWKDLISSGGYDRPNLWGDIILSDAKTCIPIFSVNPKSLSFGDVTINATSTEKTYTLTGRNLNGNVTITASAGYEISTTPETGFAANLTITPSSGNIAQLFYARFKPTATHPYSGNITITSNGAWPVNIALTGNGVSPLTTKMTTTPITINGSLSECSWLNASSVTFNHANSDNTAKVSTLWDNNYLYLGFEVTDLSIETPDSIDIWEQDAIEIYIDAGHEKALVLDPNDYQYIINAADAIAYYQAASATAILHKVMPSPNGYTVEIAIPWSQINTTPVSGKLLGILFCNDDRDNNVSKTFDWKDLISGEGYAHPNLWGDIKLSGTIACLTNSIAANTKSQQVNVFPNPFNTSSILKISSEITIKDAVMKIYDLCGKEVKIVTINNHETTLERGDIQSGIYIYSVTNNKEIMGNGKLVIQ